MKRGLAVALLLLASVLALPPLWYALFPIDAPELPAAGRRVEVAPGVGVNLLEEGDGAPVVFVHGHPGTAYDWRPMLTELAGHGFRAFAYDRVGYGRSDARTGPYLVDANAGELLALLAALRLRDVTLVGYSYGGATAIAATKKDPSRLARLVLVGAAGIGIEKRPGPPQWVAELLSGPVLSWFAAVPPAMNRFGEAFTALAFEPEQVTPGFRALSAANFAAPHTLESFRNEGRDLDGRADNDPSGIALPILVVQGEGDRLVPAEIGENLHRLAPNSELWMVEGGGHMLHVTRTDALAKRIVEFAQR